MRFSWALMLLFSIAVAAQSTNPIPQVNPNGPSLTFDFPGMRIGIAEYDEGPTGTTVFYFPQKVV